MEIYVVKPGDTVDSIALNLGADTSLSVGAACLRLRDQFYIFSNDI